VSRIPRAVRNGETVAHKRADELTADDYGRIVQHPGNRGWLQCAQADGKGVFVNTTTGCAVYPADAMFAVWGYDERDAVLRRWRRDRERRARALDGTQ
jgi:hypothetical protein